MSSDGEITESDQEKRKAKCVSSSTTTSSEDSDAYDRPMWKKKTEKDKRRKSRSRSRRRRRKRRRNRKCSSSSCDSSISSERTVRFERRRGRKEYRERERVEEKRESWRCMKCGTRKGSLKGLIHHDMNDHGLGIECAACLIVFDTNDEFRRHYELEHPENKVQCVHCKCFFEEPREMNDNRWTFIFGHIYGENFYARMADYEERNNNNAKGDL